MLIVAYALFKFDFFFVKTSCHNQGCQLMHSWGNGDRCKQAINVWHFTMDQKARLYSKIQISNQNVVSLAEYFLETVAVFLQRQIWVVNLSKGPSI